MIGTGVILNSLRRYSMVRTVETPQSLPIYCFSENGSRGALQAQMQVVAGVLSLSLLIAEPEQTFSKGQHTIKRSQSRSAVMISNQIWHGKGRTVLARVAEPTKRWSAASDPGSTIRIDWRTSFSQGTRSSWSTWDFSVRNV